MELTEEQRQRKLAKQAEYREARRDELRQKAAEYNRRPEVIERRRQQRAAKAEENRARAKAWYEANRERAIQRSSACRRRRHAENPEKAKAAHTKYNHRPDVIERRRAYYAERRDENRERAAAWYRENKEKHAVVSRRYKNSEHGKSARAANTRRRQASKLLAVPTFADRAAIRAVYRKARELSALLGVKMVVDHIIPLRSPLVCGFHAENNLQILAEDLNTAKGNHFETDW